TPGPRFCLIDQLVPKNQVAVFSFESQLPIEINPGFLVSLALISVLITRRTLILVPDLGILVDFVKLFLRLGRRARLAFEQRVNLLSDFIFIKNVGLLLL